MQNRISADIAEAILDGRTPEGAGPEVSGLATLVEEMRVVALEAPLPRLGDELSALMADGLPAHDFQAALAASAPRRAARSAARRAWGSLAAKVSIGAVAAVTVMGGMGVANALPRPVQSAVADVARVVGIHLPDPAQSAPTHPETPAPSSEPSATDVRDAAEREAESTERAEERGTENEATEGQRGENEATEGQRGETEAGPAQSSGPGPSTTGRHRQNGASGSGRHGSHSTTETEQQRAAENEAPETEVRHADDTVTGAVDVSNKPPSAGSGGSTGGDSTGGSSSGGASH